MSVREPKPRGLIIALLMLKGGKTSHSFVSRVGQLLSHPVGQFKRWIGQVRLDEERREHEIPPNRVPEIRFARKQDASSNPIQFEMYLPGPTLLIAQTVAKENF